MKNTKVIVATLFILLAVTLSVFTGCDQQKDVDYYPLGVGSYWEYSVLTYMDMGITKMNKEIFKVVGKERVGDLESYIVDRYTLEGRVPSVAQYREYLAKTGEGILCTKRAFPLLIQLQSIYPSIQSSIIHPKPEERFKTTLKENDKWRWEGTVTLVPMEDVAPGETPEEASAKPPKIQAVEGFMEYKYAGHETIHVMGKDMDCIKLEVFGKSDSGQEIESTIWYGPNIGKVREEQRFFEGSKSTKFIFELINYNITHKEAFDKE
ncbi:MAG: hypothetical protein ACLFQV_05370 [Vulcanimicrobiota bacterium]